MYRSILCYMVVSLTSSIPFMIKAVPLTKISSDIVCSGIISCIEILTQNNFYLRGITSDNHPTNVSCYGKLLKQFPSTISSECILNPSDREKHIYLLFDTVHIIKNIRNNLLSSKYYQIPEFNFQTKLNINIPPGTVSWSAFHRLHEKDMNLNAHLKKPQKYHTKFYTQGTTNNPSLLHSLFFTEQRFQPCGITFQKIQLLHL